MSSSTQIGRELAHPLDRLHTVLGFAHELDIGLAGQQLPQPIARGLFVVDEENADHDCAEKSQLQFKNS